MFIQKTLHCILLILFCSSMSVFHSIAFAQNPGEICDPDRSTGHAARIISFEGTVAFYDADGRQIQIQEGSVVPAGSTIITGAGVIDKAVLSFEDGTDDRLSRLRIATGSQVVVTGGLYCSDLRPKADEGRWIARELGLELHRGFLHIELAEGVSYSYNLEVQTPNSVARMRRGTQDAMKAFFVVSRLDERTKVPVIEHPRIRQQVTGLLMGRSMEDLSPREREGVMSQAAMAAINMGLVDIDAMGLMENPQIQSTLAMMTRGRDLSELDENERNMALQMVGTLAINQGLLDPATMLVYDQPDENTVVGVEAGTMRVHNKHRGWRRQEAVDVGTGMMTEVKGYEIPLQPAEL